jgi:2-polyprenyl-6-hydroxyphenyl methylase/3-demethylubiquinone-9 3-methyltransferase
MKKPEPSPDWPENWRTSFFYDLQEVFGPVTSPGYARAYANRKKQTLDLVAKAAPGGGKILDVAAAQGNFTLALAELGYAVTWNDLRAGLENYVRLKWERGTVEFAPGNVFDINPATGFDVVLVTEIIEHVAHPDLFLKKIGDLVAPGGHVVMTTPNGGYFLNCLPRFSDCPDPTQFEAVQFQPNSDGHIFLLHEDEVRALARQAGFEVVDLRLFSNSLTCGHLKTERLLRLLPAPWIDGLECATARLHGPIRRKINAGMAVLMRKYID